MQQRFKTLRRLVSGVAVVGMASLGMAAVSASSSGASVTKTVITFAEGPGAAPDYIFPFMTLGYFSVANISQFQYYMYRPLYWVGTGSKPIVSNRLSVAKAPAYSNGNKTVKITLKTYKWSDGEKVTATDVNFFLNMWQAAKTKYAAWAPGGFSIPTIIKSVKIDSPTTLTITLKSALNPHWFEYNELAAVTPFPLAWTVTSTTAKPGSAGCAKAAYGTATAKCHAVFVFLSTQSGHNPTKPTTKINALPTYASNPLWAVVDGPWKLKSFGPTAPAVMVPNPSYSGPNKPTYKEFIEKPFTSATAEFNALVGGTIDFGILPATDVTSPATSPVKPSQTTKPGKNNPRLATTYSLVPTYRWGINYFPENFNSVGDSGHAGAIFKQLYVRQAMQELVDQTLYINRIFKGYGVPTYGPVPVWPHNPYSSKVEEKNPYAYNPAKAKALLKSHGWKVVRRGVDTCKRAGTGPGDCGNGIPKGAKLDFTL
ncbi:MAG: ABC transporter substrate-binding protein, partial [Nitrososphaerales archaeon]